MSVLDTLSLHDALPILGAVERERRARLPFARPYLSANMDEWDGRHSSSGVTTSLASSGSLAESPTTCGACASTDSLRSRSEEHTSELQSPCNLVCRLLL